MHMFHLTDKNHQSKFLIVTSKTGYSKAVSFLPNLSNTVIFNSFMTQAVII